MFGWRTTQEGRRRADQVGMFHRAAAVHRYRHRYRHRHRIRSDSRDRPYCFLYLIQRRKYSWILPHPRVRNPPVPVDHKRGAL